MASIAEFGVWSCEQCGAQKAATVHQKRQKYCSYACMSEAYKTRMSGEANPHYKGLEKECRGCGIAYRSYYKTTHCSIDCYRDRRKREREPKPPKERPIRPLGAQIEFRFRLKKVCPYKHPKKHVGLVDFRCVQCNGIFQAYKCQARTYCSYKCHLESGGAKRAGQASKRAIMKYGAKKDANHGRLMAVIRSNCPAHDLSGAGCGVPDGIAWISGGWQLFDIKNPQTAYGRRGLNDVQKRWVNETKGGPVYLIHNEEEADRFSRGKLDGLKKYEPVSEVAT